MGDDVLALPLASAVDRSLEDAAALLRFVEDEDAERFLSFMRCSRWKGLPLACCNESTSIVKETAGARGISGIIG
jgi:hypothetical protein